MAELTKRAWSKYVIGAKIDDVDGIAVYMYLIRYSVHQVTMTLLQGTLN